MFSVQKGLRTYNFKLTHFNKNCQSVKCVQTFWDAIRAYVSRRKDLKVTRSIKRVPHFLIHKIFCMKKIQSHTHSLKSNLMNGKLLTIRKYYNYVSLLNYHTQYRFIFKAVPKSTESNK